MRALLDVNVLIALLDAAHVHHRVARKWLAREGGTGWASCPITQNGCLRILTHSRYPNAQSVPAVAARLAEAIAHPLHEFWPDDISLLDAGRIDSQRVLSASQITDLYLLALAVAHRGRLVTFDRSIIVEAVAGAELRHLVEI
ncbi:MAG: Ribonuclease VapC44 [Steroidobacteraceae bacterium]|nr:Ribonuclease VapC44 [Steroidobacteraceae bacterium]